MGGNLAIEVAARCEAGKNGLPPLKAIVTLEASYALNYDVPVPKGSMNNQRRDIYEKPLETPCLIGLSQAGMPQRMNAELLGELFKTAVVFRYDNGHRALPIELEARSAFCEAVRGFVHCPRQHGWEGGSYTDLGGHD